MKRFLFQKIVFRERPWLWKGLLVIVLLASFGLRMFNLTNPPLDFASTRQLFSVLKARGMYYHYLTNVPEETRQLAISLGDVGTVEPVVFETLVSQTYRITGEYTWIARIYSSLFWVLGGLALFLLIRQLASPSVAMIGTLFFLFLPYGVVASRAFMPDPLMVALIIYAIWALLRWQKSDKWKWAILFGLFSGAALFVKNVSAFFIMGGFLGVLLGSKGLKWSIRNPQVYLMVLLSVLPVGVYTINGMLNSGMSGQFALRFFPSMWKDPAFYFRWAWTVNWTIGLGTVLFAAFSVLLSEPRNERPFLIGLWVGYLIFGMIFPYHIYTHDYYQLPFIPIVALSMAPALNLLFERYFAHAPGLFLRLCLLGVVVVGLAVQGYAGARQILDSDYRNEPSFWADIGDKLGHHASVIGLTQDYGYRLAYWGWQSSSAWFTSDDINLRYLAGENIDVAQQFKDDVAGKQFFLVTMFGELDNQPVIKNLLYSDYPIFSETDEYIIFDLQHPLNQP